MEKNSVDTEIHNVAREPMAELVRRGYEAVERGDIAALDEMLADDVTWHGTPASSNERLSRDYDGKAAVFGFFSELGRLSSGTLRRDVARLTRTDRMWTGAGRVPVPAGIHAEQPTPLGA